MLTEHGKLKQHQHGSSSIHAMTQYILQELECEIAGLRAELSEARRVAEAASATWDRFRKERDLHRMHHKRVAQEKNKLITDIKRLKVIVTRIVSHWPLHYNCHACC
jgi:hypothetical protein